MFFNFSLYDLIVNFCSAREKRLPWNFNSTTYLQIYRELNFSKRTARHHFRLKGQQEHRYYSKNIIINNKPYNPQLPTLVFCLGLEKNSFEYEEVLKLFHENYNIVVFTNSYFLNTPYEKFCNKIIYNRFFDQSSRWARWATRQIKKLPNLQFVFLTIYDNGCLVEQLEKQNIPNILLFDEHYVFSQKDLSCGLAHATRVIYANETCAQKSLYDYIYGYPKQITYLSAATTKVRFKKNTSENILILGSGQLSYASGFDIFQQIAQLFKTKYPDENVNFVWLKQKNNLINDGFFEKKQTWQSIPENKFFVRVIENNFELYYQNTSIFVDTSRLSNNLSLIKSALSANIPTFILDKSEPLSMLFSQNHLDDCLISQKNSKNFVDILYKTLKSDTDQKHIFLQLANQITDVSQFSQKILTIGLEASLQIKQELQDVKALLNCQEFDVTYWKESATKKLTCEQANHYVRNWNNGIRPTRPCPGFHPGIYAEHNMKENDYTNPFLHYLNAEKPKGPWQWQVIQTPTPISQVALKQKVALQIHAFYIEKINSILNALLVNKLRPDLFISVKNEHDKSYVQSLFKDYPKKVVVSLCPNKGRDISPLLTLFRTQLMHEYDIIGHFHTKESKHIANRDHVDRWFKYLLVNLLGDGKNLATADTIIEKLFTDKDINLIFPDDKNAVGWAKNYYAAKKYASLLGVNHLPHFINFPVGTMFWARKKLLQPFFDLKLEWKDYPNEPLPLDGTDLHAIERLFGAVNQIISKKFACTMLGDLRF